MLLTPLPPTCCCQAAIDIFGVHGCGCRQESGEGFVARLRKASQSTPASPGGDKAGAAAPPPSPDASAVANDGLDFARIRIFQPAAQTSDEEVRSACSRLKSARDLRARWVLEAPVLPWDASADAGACRRVATPPPGAGGAVELGPDAVVVMHEGVARVYASQAAADAAGAFAFGAPDQQLDEFFDDYHALVATVTNGPTNTVAHERLHLMQKKFEMHRELNIGIELEQNRQMNSLNDIYTVAKVDTHIHLAAAFSANRLLKFIQRKATEDHARVVHKGLTLRAVLEGAGIFVAEDGRPQNLTVDKIHVQADASLFTRFDLFNKKYNISGSAVMRSVFLKTNNDIGGAYFAELTQQLLTKFQNAKRGNGT